MDNQIRDFLKANRPIEATEEERVAIMRISKKAILIMLMCAIILLILFAKDGLDIDEIKFWVGFLVVIGGIIFILEMKDKIKYKTYDKIYSTYVYVESAYFVNKAYHLNVCYYDFDYGMFNKCKMNIDRMDVKTQKIGVGKVIRVLVGEKKSRIHYIAMKLD